MSENNAGYCPAYLEPQRVNGTSRDTLGKGTEPSLRKGFALPEAAPRLWDAFLGAMLILPLPCRVEPA